jgi:hypothetical protein
MIVRENDVGVVLRLTVKEQGAAVDLSASTIVEILLRPPLGAARRKTATFTTDGSDGQIEYQTVAGDLNVVGAWSVQARTQFPTGLDVTSAGVALTVERAG